MESFTNLISFFFKNLNRGIVHIPLLINKKKFLLIILAFLLYSMPGTAGVSPFNFKFVVNKIDYTDYTPPSPVGLITVTFSPGHKGKYLSVLAENNTENISGMILENLYLPPVDTADPITEFSTTFLLSEISVSFKLPLRLTLTAYVTDFPDYFPFLNDSIAEVTTVNVTGIIYDVGVIKVPQIQVPNAPVDIQQQPPGDDHRSFIYRRDIDNIDLDSSSHPANNTFAGDGGACAPAAAANSIKWMEKTYQEIKLPQDFTLRKTMEELSSWMRRRNNDGPSDVQMIQGKLGFISAYSLPVEVKFQCEGIDEDIEAGTETAKNLKKMGEKPSWDFLKQMMEEGEDVEMNYAWKDSTGKFDSVGHSVTITGILEFASGRKRISYKHDTNQRCAGGLKEEVHEISTDSAGWTRFGPDNEFYITCIIAESPEGSQFSERFAAYLNEFQTFSTAADEFVEVVVKKNIPDLHKFMVTVYNSSGEDIINASLDKFQPGESADSFTVYSYTFSGNVLPDMHGGIGLTFGGSPITESFISWGGIVTAVNGEWTGLTSTVLGITPIAGHSYALVGTGNDYNNFYWISNPGPSPGMFNSSQTVPVELTSFVASAEQNFVLLKWTTATETNNKGFEIEKLHDIKILVGENQLAGHKDWEKIGFIIGAGTASSMKEYSFVDKNISPGKSSYRLKQIDFDGSFKYSDIVAVNFIPLRYELAQNYPNPFNPNTIIEFSIENEEFVSLKLFNIIGQEVMTIISEIIPGGRHSIPLDGAGLSSGLYIYRLTTENFTQSKRMLLMK